MAFKIFRKNCCGLDVHKTWIYACIGITDTNGRTEYKQARFSSFSKDLQELADWLANYSCTDVCMESTGKYFLMQTTDMTLAEIAYSCGFSSQSYYSYAFKRHMHTTPRKHLAKLNNNYEI